MMGFLDDYEPVEDRLAKFWADHPDGRIWTDRMPNDDAAVVVFMAEAYRDIADKRPAATGWASEREGSSPVNKTSALENCETSAIGRALANLGYAAKGKRPSREEMLKASEGERAPSRGPSSSGSPSDDVAAERKGEQGRDNPGSGHGGDPARSLPAEDRADGGAESGEYGEGSPGSASSDRERLWRELKAAFGGQAKAIAAVNAAAGKNYTARTITDANSAEIAAALAQEVME